MPYASAISILGHAGKEADCKVVGNTTCTTVSVAVETNYKSEGEWKKRTTWWRVTAWGKPGEWLARDCRKGSLIFASGEASVREWEKDGKRGFSAEINANHCRVCDAKKDAKEESDPVASAPQVPQSAGGSVAGLAGYEPPFAAAGKETWA